MSKTEITEDTICLIVCHPDNARELIDKDPEIAFSLLITHIMPKEEMMVVPEEDFVEWLTGYAGGKNEDTNSDTNI